MYRNAGACSPQNHHIAISQTLRSREKSEDKCVLVQYLLLLILWDIVEFHGSFLPGREPLGRLVGVHDLWGLARRIEEESLQL